MEEELDFSKYDNKCFLCMEETLTDYKVTIYDLMMEKQGQKYVPILIIYSCEVFGNVLTEYNYGKRELAKKKFFPEYNSNVKEITRIKFDELKNKIQNFYWRETKVQADKLHFYFQCQALC